MEQYKDLLKQIEIPERIRNFKFPKISLPKINFREMQKPPRWLVLTIAILIEFILLFFILWLFDDRTVFDNDYKATNYRGEYIKWGWFHMGLVISSIIIEIIWFFVIVGGEFMALKETDRVFYNLYR